MKRFEHFNAKTIDEAVSLLRQYKGEAKVIAGGTELLGFLKDDFLPTYPKAVINLKTIPSLDYIKEEAGNLRIGALAKLNDIVKSTVVKEKYKVLAEAAHSVGHNQIRHMGTIGGNLCQDVCCWYYRAPKSIGHVFPCTRKGGEAFCYAVPGDNRFSSILGGTTPCRAACPANLDIQSYIALITQGRFKEALEVIRRDLPFPMIVGRVCHAPCERECDRAKVDDPVSIRALKRFVADYELKGEREKPSPIPRTHEEKVAVIGSGPAGLTAAYQLVSMGYPVTVFESLAKPGGMLRVGIPEYRLPKKILDTEVNYVSEVGVEIKTNTRVGKDITFDELLQDYKAIFIAVGAQLTRKLEIDGTELRGVLWGLDFLRDVNLGRDVKMEKRVLVVGGGNVAIDISRIAHRLGAKEVQLVCLESREEMPAYEDQIQEAVNEGVILNVSWGPKRILGDDKKATGVELVRCTSVFDEDGKFNPSYDETITKSIETDMVIIAIGQSSDVFFLPESIRVSKMNTIVVDPVTLETSEAGVFAGGDAVLGPASVVEAVAAGNRAAVSIDRYLRGENIKIGREKEIGRVISIFESLEERGIDEKPRIPTPLIRPDQRIGNFEEVERGYTKELALKEAKRCLVCGCHAINASDMAPALIALNAKAKTSKRMIALEEFFNPFTLPTALDDDEILTEIQIPTPTADMKGVYLKFRLRKAIDFAIVSVAALLTLEKGVCKDARIVLGGVAPIPWRSKSAEDAIKGKAINETTAEAAGKAAVGEAVPLTMNAYKVPIAQTLVKRAILAAI